MSALASGGLGSRQKGVRLQIHSAAILILVSVLITGCAPSVAILMSPGSERPPMRFIVMPRDTDDVYHGVVHTNGCGAGTVTVTVDGRTYTGPLSKTGSTALLLSTDNHELRCDMQADGMERSVGDCVDDSGRIYDALLRE